MRPDTDICVNVALAVTENPRKGYKINKLQHFTFIYSSSLSNKKLINCGEEHEDTPT